jgi:hypothetical protein
MLQDSNAPKRAKKQIIAFILLFYPRYHRYFAMTKEDTEIWYQTGLKVFPRNRIYAISMCKTKILINFIILH